MSRATLGFVYSALFYLMVGVAMGLVMTLVPGMGNWKLVHAHLNLIGFVMFTIFGIAYHILPRFSGRPLHSEGLAWFQMWLANFALVGFELFTVLAIYGKEIAWGRGFFAGLLALSFYLFIYNIARTLLARPK